jgi:hypothetical protein
MIKALFVFGFLILSGTIAYPCTCVRVSHRKEFHEADAIFAGQVISIVEDKSYVPPKLTDSKIPSQTLVRLQNHVDATKRFIVTFKVEEGFKGTDGKEISLLTYQGDGSCFGIVFDVGERYLVYAWRDKEGLTDNGLCSRTKVLDKDSREYQELSSFWFRFWSHMPFV